jgi:hypothetical protein
MKRFEGVPTLPYLPSASKLSLSSNAIQTKHDCRHRKCNSYMEHKKMDSRYLVPPNNTNSSKSQKIRNVLLSSNTSKGKHINSAIDFLKYSSNSISILKLLLAMTSSTFIYFSKSSSTLSKVINPFWWIRLEYELIPYSFRSSLLLY